MPRPIKFRRVCCLPENKEFGPLDFEMNNEDIIILFVEEFESIRLIDLEGFTQEECAAQMGIARTTVQGIYITARKKLADVLVNGKKLFIEGGQYKLCDGIRPCGRGCRRFKKKEEESMKKVAIASQGELLSQHFGHCPEFNIYEIDNKNIKFVEKFENEGFGCHDLPILLEEKGVDTIISGGMGANPKLNFQQRGIEALIVEVDKIENILKAFVEGNIESTKETCEEHGHHHGDGEECCHNN